MDDIVEMLFDPQPDTAHRFPEALAEASELVIHARGHYGMHAAPYQSVALHLPQGLGQHLLTYASDALLQTCKAQLTGIGKLVDHNQRPLVGDPIQYLADQHLFPLMSVGDDARLHSFRMVSIERSGAFLPRETDPPTMGGSEVIIMSPQKENAFRKLGSVGPEVFPLALGCMGMSGMYGPADENESIATIQAAVERGITLIDTGDFYGMGHNEMLIGRALKGRRDKVLLSVKFGALRSPDGAWIGYDARPAAVKNFLSHTLTRLGVDHIDIYRPSRLDSSVPVEETIGAIADMIKAGYVRAIGLSEVGAATIRRAHAAHPVSDLQIEYSLISRGPEAEIFPVLRELGIGITAYGVLSRGLLSGSAPTGQKDFRAHLPRFTAENRARNQRLVDELNRLAAEKGVRPSQLAIAWVLAKGRDIVPVIGARKRTQLEESLAALGVHLSEDELRQIEAAIPASAVAGTRYDERQMRHLDSETAAASQRAM